jgi:ATP-dependent DNA ligase
MATTLTELRDALDDIKAESGTGSKQRKQDRFAEVYTADAGHLIVGERYDAAGIGPSTAEDAAESALGELPDGATLSESIAKLGTQDGIDTPALLVQDLDEVAALSGNDQQERLEKVLSEYTEPSLVTLALLDDESFGLGTSQMREVFFDGSRSERKRAESLVEGTVEFINRARNDQLPDEPEMFIPFDVMLAKPESAGEPENAVAQLKVDGYRLVIHVSDGQARAFTRRKKDVTHSLPELNDIDWPAGDYILDGEVIADDGSYSTTSSRVGKKAENIDHSTEMHFACFDMIVSNGDDLSREPYKTRYQKLEQLTTQAIDDPRIYFLEASSNIEAVKKHALEQDYEGVILKDLYGEYEFGTRSSNWTKEKHEREHIDAVVIGFQEGDGRLDGTLGKLELESADGTPLGSVGTGFTDAERDRIWRNRDDWLGETVEVSAEAYDDGLRFPVYERDRRADGEPDHIDKVEELLDPA